MTGLPVYTPREICLSVHFSETNIVNPSLGFVTAGGSAGSRDQRVQSQLGHMTTEYRASLVT